jgi:epoxyqueuosine reductase QueG
MPRASARASFAANASRGANAGSHSGNENFSFHGHTSRSCCPWNVRFSKELPDDSPYRRREALAGKDAPQLAREILTMSQEEFSRAFKGSPMKRAKLRGLKRKATVVLGNVGTSDEMVREHAAWALVRLGRAGPLNAA